VAKRRAKGEGTIFKEKSGNWRADVTLPNGKRKSKRSKSQQVVKDWLLEQRKAQKDNLLLKDEKITVGEYLDRYLADVAAHTLKPSTLHSYNYLIRDHIKPNIGHIRLTNLRPDHLQALYSAKLNSGLSKRTVQYIHAVIRKSLNQAVKWGLLYRNPANAAIAPQPKRKPPQTLSADQVKLFLGAVEGHRLYSLYVLAITTGMRKGELLGLYWEDVDLDKRTISIHRTLVDIRGTMHVGQPKSDSAYRTIILSETVCEILKPQQEEGLVFTSTAGTFLSQRNVTRHFHSVLDRLGLPRMRFHDLRHTAATLLLEDNVHPKVVQDMLGHSSITLTLDTYSHVIPGHHDEAAKSMERFFE